jgi:hypothetical protein
MLLLSALLVFGTLLLFGMHVTSASPSVEFGAGLIIRGGVPWTLLALLWGGVGLGVASVVRKRTLPKLGVLALEIALVAFSSWYLLAGSTHPVHALNVDVGSPFPAYALQDQDEVLHQRAVSEKRAPALYVFYRGHW